MKRRRLEAQRLAHHGAVTITLLLACVLWLSCGPAQGLPSSAIVRQPAAAAPEKAPSGPFQIPELENILIDGSAEDWANHGLSLDVLTPFPVSSFDPREFDARAKLGWESRGLLLFVEVTDTLPDEAAPALPIWTGDAVEIFVAERVSGQRLIQHVIAPGVAPGAPEPRHIAYDHLSQASPQVAPTIARLKSPAGYTLEALLPWASLELEPTLGLQFALQLYANDAGGAKEPSRRLVWFPESGTHEDTSRMHAVQLARKASSSVTLSAAARVLGIRGVEVIISSSVKPRSPRLSLNGDELPPPRFEQHARLWTGKTLLALEPSADSFGPLVVSAVRQRAHNITIPDVKGERQRALDELEVVARPGVFESERFPALDLVPARRARELLGDYTLDVRWYDREHRPVTRPTLSGRYGAVVAVVAEGEPRLTRHVTTFRVAETAPGWQRAAIEAHLKLPTGFGIPPDALAREQRAVGEWLRGALERSAQQDQRAAVLLAFLQEAQPGAAPRSLASRAESVDQRWWHEQRRLLGTLKPYRYLTRLPAAAEARPAKRWPLLLFLHGSGERGSDLTRLAAWEPIRILERQAQKYPFILVAPQCPAGTRWSVPLLEDLLSEVKTKYAVDTERIYVAGASMGGFGTWSLVAEHADWFAAAVPICGGGAPEDAAALLDLPVWVFHGALDDAVAPEHSQAMVRALREKRGRVRFTLYGDRGHNAWTPALSSESLFEWLLEQRRGQPTQSPSTKLGAEPDFVQ